jgi:DNA-binding LytR/AlgR family response regulator
MKQPVQVLIVEDELLVAVAIEEALLRAGLGVSGIASTYEEAIALIGRIPVDLAIVDVGLAGEPDGVATARALLRQQWIPLIYLTGTTDDATFERAKATNPYAFLNKPLRPQELIQQVLLAIHNALQTETTIIIANDEPLYLPTSQGYARVRQSDIYYLEGAGNFTHVYLTNEAAKRIIPSSKPGQPLLLTGNLGHWGNHLSLRLFYRLSKSLIINLTYIDRVETHQIILGDCSISLPDGARKSLLERLHIVRTR